MPTPTDSMQKMPRPKRLVWPLTAPRARQARRPIELLARVVTASRAAQRECKEPER